MRHRTALALACVCSSAAVAADAQTPEVARRVVDGTAIFADIHVGPSGTAGPVVLTFHQGGGNARGEYRAITPRLMAEGFSVMTFDIRGGGDRFDATNRVPTGEAFGYCDAVPEIEAAIDMARERGFTGPLALWGSSYSAALVMQVATRRPEDVAAVLAFSPASGDPMEGCQPAPFAPLLVDAAIPTLVLRPPNEAALPHVAEQLRTFDELGIATYVAAHGTHGSSMLDPARVDGDVAPQWRVVLDFLNMVLVAPDR